MQFLNHLPDVWKNFSFKGLIIFTRRVGPLNKKRISEIIRAIAEKNLDILLTINNDEKDILKKIADDIENDIISLQKKQNQIIKINIDGSSLGNPGPAGIGLIIKDYNDNIIDKVSEFVGNRTNNEAEYLALIKAMDSIKKLKAKDVIIYSDSELLVKQINNEFKIKHPVLKELYFKFKDLKEKLKLKSFKIIWIPRESNKEADTLANNAVQLHNNQT